ncbi:MAG: adenosylhomocysteinase [Candidatus Jordarchaeales archaeon]
MTQVGKNYEIKDIGLASQGEKLIRWAEDHMPVLKMIRERFEKEKPLKNVVVGACLHVTKETAVLVRTLQAGGATVYLCASNPLSTQDPVAAALVKHGIGVYAWYGMDTEGYYRSIANVIKARPNVTLDDGADLVSTIAKLKHKEGGEEIKIVKKVLGEGGDWWSNVWGGAEETTTGVIRLRAMAEEGKLPYPILATNDTPTKWEFDNVWGTGQSTLDGIMRATSELIAGKVVVVAGYGHCGRGIALRAKGLGARRVIVTEINPHRALTAALEGIDVMPMYKAAEVGDIFITATGCKDVIRKEHIEKMKDGAILANAGHFDVEINLKDLESLAVSKEEIRPNVEEYRLKDGRRIYLLCKGRLVNLVAAEGHPSSVMDMSFSDQALAVEWIVKHRDELKKLGNVVLDIPKEIDMTVAELKCKAMGIELEQLTKEQMAYLRGWREGTA